ncbi:cache domain-containing protein [Spirochaeta africana]|uniref:Double Cache domain-containing protein n=1 Tax=Spirochaeta africana (strain ATCC 700263 / DSM 8902 / Z-7692) TaxID=889378 RepID=H1NB74_SPIAZ|nr:cache domain-containing protein [Spirochaeta africana]AFG36523.1 hypothetical protein Spiaf_0418 [Spirochaeta africana DSM 8902]
MRTIGLRGRVLIVVTAAVLLISGFQLLQQLRENRQQLAAANQQLFTQLEESWETSLQAELDALSMALHALTMNDELIELFAADERQQLYQNLQGFNQVLEDDYGIAQFQFHRPPAESFLRMHLPDVYGDDLSGFRATVVQANRRPGSRPG